MFGIYVSFSQGWYIFERQTCWEFGTWDTFWGDQAWLMQRDGNFGGFPNKIVRCLGCKWPLLDSFCTVLYFFYIFYIHVGSQERLESSQPGTLSLLFFTRWVYMNFLQTQGKDKDLQKMLHRAGLPGYANATLANTGATYLTLGDFSILDASTKKRQEQTTDLVAGWRLKSCALRKGQHTGINPYIGLHR